MPPLSKRPFKLERSHHFETGLYLDILQSQQTDTNGYLADTLLMCDGGTIRVHAFILQAASPFFRKAIMSQGEDYPFIREVMLPDFPVREIESMLSLIYKGSVTLDKEEEKAELENTLKFFKVSGVDFNSVKTKNEGTTEQEKNEIEIVGKLKIHELNRIPQDLRVKMDDESAIDETEENSGGTNGYIVGGGRSSRSRRTGKVGAASSKSKSPAPSTSSTSSSSAATIVMKIPKIILPRILPSAKSPAAAAPQSSESLPQPPPEKSPLRKKNKLKKDNNEDPETDEEDKDWTQPNFKDKTWFRREALRCQECKKDYDQVKEVLECISTHRKENVRCCFCFRIYSSTEMLYRHYKKRHRSGGKENSIMCYYCDHPLSYNAVSSHVISSHFKIVNDNNGNDEAPSSTSTAPKPCSTNRSPTKPNGIIKKEVKIKKEKEEASTSTSGGGVETPISLSSDEEVTYDSDVLEDYDPAPTPILIPHSPLKTSIPAPNSRKRRSDSSEDEWNPRTKRGGGGTDARNASGGSSVPSSSSTSTKRVKVTSSSEAKNIAPPPTEPPPKKKEPRLKVPDLDITIKKVTCTGSTFFLRLQKKRVDVDNND